MCTYKVPSYGGRYNPNFGMGIHSGNAWKLTTVRGAEWARNKQAEGRGGCPKPTPDSDHVAFEQRLRDAQDSGQGITKPELAEILRGKTVLTNGEAKSLGQFALTNRFDGRRAFARESTRQIALALHRGMPLAQASAQFGLRL